MVQHNQQKHYIYARYCEGKQGSDRPFDVGRTSRPLKKRMREHYRAAARNNAPMFTYRRLETVHGDIEVARCREQHWMDHYRRKGCKLTNARNELAAKRHRSKHISWSEIPAELFRTEYEKAKADHEAFARAHPNALGVDLPMRSFDEWWNAKDRTIEEIHELVTPAKMWQIARRVLREEDIIVSVCVDWKPLCGGLQVGVRVTYLNGVDKQNRCRASTMTANILKRLAPYGIKADGHLGTYYRQICA